LKLNIGRNLIIAPAKLKTQSLDNEGRVPARISPTLERNTMEKVSSKEDGEVKRALKPANKHYYCID
jgi:hypothetical protein